MINLKNILEQVRGSSQVEGNDDDFLINSDKDNQLNYVIKLFNS